MEPLKAGTVVTLDLAHKAPFGYFLTDGRQEILMHANDAIEPVDEQAKQKVFLYQDHQGRLAATMTIPKIRIGIYDWAPVVSVHKRYGVFVDIGIHKDILFSKDDLPESLDEWPQKGDRLYLSLMLDKKDRLFAKPANESIMNVISIPAPESFFNKETEATVYRLMADGAHFITEDGYLGFIHRRESDRKMRIGRTFHGRVTGIKDGRITLSMLPRSFEMIDQHAAGILEYLRGRGGTMPYTDKSLPEDIRKHFSISKGDFKKALGKLMKEGKLVQKDGWSYLVEK
ncbi:hypothetical protein EWH91_00150 [Sporolactobacillus sp. THM19-2]|nr:hypothetical protein EWH91_00150 [Sporolactobacillus sp. THM19-2]